MSFLTNRKTKKKYRRRKRRHSERESQAYTSPRESEKIGHGYSSGGSIL